MINYNTFSVIFYTRKTRNLSEEISIYARITVDGKRSEMSLKRSIPSYQWDFTKGRTRGIGQDVRLLNQYLDQVYTKILRCHAVLLEREGMDGINNRINAAG